MNKETKIYLSSFSKRPFGRYLTDGEYNGQKFRNEVLVPKLQDENLSKVVVIIDDLDIDLGSSFLEEAFGGIVRNKLVPYEDVKNKLTIISKDPRDVQRIQNYIVKAYKKLQGQSVLRNGK